MNFGPPEPLVRVYTNHIDLEVIYRDEEELWHLCIRREPTANEVENFHTVNGGKRQKVPQPFLQRATMSSTKRFQSAGAALRSLHALLRGSFAKGFSVRYERVDRYSRY